MMSSWLSWLAGHPYLLDRNLSCWPACSQQDDEEERPWRESVCLGETVDPNNHANNLWNFHSNWRNIALFTNKRVWKARSQRFRPKMHENVPLWLWFVLLEVHASTEKAQYRQEFEYVDFESTNRQQSSDQALSTTINMISIDRSITRKQDNDEVFMRRTCIHQ